MGLFKMLNNFLYAIGIRDSNGHHREIRMTNEQQDIKETAQHVESSLDRLNNDLDRLIEVLKRN